MCCMLLLTCAACCCLNLLHAGICTLLLDCGASRCVHAAVLHVLHAIARVCCMLLLACAAVSLVCMCCRPGTCMLPFTCAACCCLNLLHAGICTLLLDCGASWCVHAAVLHVLHAIARVCCMLLLACAAVSLVCMCCRPGTCMLLFACAAGLVLVCCCLHVLHAIAWICCMLVFACCCLHVLQCLLLASAACYCLNFLCLSYRLHCRLQMHDMSDIMQMMPHQMSRDLHCVESKVYWTYYTYHCTYPSEGQSYGTELT